MANVHALTYKKNQSRETVRQDIIAFRKHFVPDSTHRLWTSVYGLGRHFGSLGAFLQPRGLEKRKTTKHFEGQPKPQLGCAQRVEYQSNTLAYVEVSWDACLRFGKTDIQGAVRHD